MKRYISIFCVLLVFVMNTATAQSGVFKNGKVKVVTKTYIGKFTGNPVKLTLEQAKQALSAYLQVIDQNNNVYEISSYQLAYYRVSMTEDEVTGKVSPTTTLVSDRFYKTPLPQSWKKVIDEDLQKGEELVFFDIIALDQNGKKFFAPNLKIVVE